MQTLVEEISQAARRVNPLNQRSFPGITVQGADT